jgi:sodium/proline symporter
MAVSWTDFIQGMIMFFAIVAIPVLGMMKMGGIDASLNAIKEVDPQLLSLTITEEGKTISAITIISLMAWGLGYWGQPHILARFMAIRHSRMIKKSRRIAMVWVLISLCCAILVGLLGNVLLENRLEGADSETVFMYLVDQLSNPLFTGLLLSAILAAIMSTADSQLLVASSALTEDIYRLIVPHASQKQLVWVGRLAVILIAIIAFFIAFNPEASVLELVAYAWAGFGAAFGPLVLLSLYWKKMTYPSAIAGIISGGITVLVWKQLEGGIFDLYEIVPGFIVSVVCIVSISLWGRPVRPGVEAEYESVESFDI